MKQPQHYRGAREREPEGKERKAKRKEHEGLKNKDDQFGGDDSP